MKAVISHTHNKVTGEHIIYISLGEVDDMRGTISNIVHLEAFIGYTMKDLLLSAITSMKKYETMLYV